MLSELLSTHRVADGRVKVTSMGGRGWESEDSRGSNGGALCRVGHEAKPSGRVEGKNGGEVHSCLLTSVVY